MPFVGERYVLAGDVADSIQQFNTASEQTLTLEPACVALLVAARGGTGPVSMSFDNTAASATNGLAIPVGTAPILVPLGYHAHVDHKVRMLGGAGSFLDVVQLA
jgi:hypothetical protein